MGEGINRPVEKGIALLRKKLCGQDKASNIIWEKQKRKTLLYILISHAESQRKGRTRGQE